MSGHGDNLKITIGDLDIMARTVFMEARSEPFDGAKAVVHVVINRVIWRSGDRWTTLAQACLDWLQFSGWRDEDPNLKAAIDADLNNMAMRRAWWAMLEALHEPDPLAGARHYHADYVSPKWAKGHSPVARIGRHFFYNTVA